MQPVNAIAGLAAANNAEWCDLVCRSHAVQGTLDEQAWTSPTRTPPFYPDAVTLVPDVSIPELLARIDTSVGCSIKDSFASLDLRSFGFSVLFDAEWTVRRAAPVPRTAAGPLWEVVGDPETFALWEQAWRGNDGPSNVLRVDLLDHDSVVVLAARTDDHVMAGAILLRSPEVVGVSNFFSTHGAVSASWGNCLAHVGELLPGAVLVGYEPLDTLDATRLDEFETAGPLRVWRRDG